MKQRFIEKKRNAIKDPLNYHLSPPPRPLFL